MGLIKISLILSESNIDDSFIQIIINFNEGKVYFDTEEKCLYKYIDLIEQVSPKFIINAYDLLSYFLEDENNYHYIVTNPLEIEESNMLDKDKYDSSDHIPIFCTFTVK